MSVTVFCCSLLTIPTYVLQTMCSLLMLITGLVTEVMVVSLYALLSAGCCMLYNQLIAKWKLSPWLHNDNELAIDQHGNMETYFKILYYFLCF